MRETILYMSTFPPRGCGIATFTQDLITAMDQNTPYKAKVIAINNDEIKNPVYSSKVLLEIDEKNILEYEETARKINKMKHVKLVNIQHEFGIYGGDYLNYLSAFLEKIKKPVVISLHSVLPKPPENLKSILQYLSVKTSAFIVMADTAVGILEKDYGIQGNVFVIHHGIHDVPYEPSIIAKTKLGYEDKLVLTSFGLIHRGKKFDDIINALPKVVKKFPNVLYLIIGKTHPRTLNEEGEKYRKKLKKLVKKHKLTNNVKFVNKYVELPELLEYLKATDIFLSSGGGLHQIVSGTLSYAMGCGRPVITIPFLHAKEAVTKERGILVKLNDPTSFSKAILRLLSNQKLRERMGKNAHDFTRHMVWDNVAHAHMKVFKKYI